MLIVIIIIHLFNTKSICLLFPQSQSETLHLDFYQIKGWINDTLIDIAYLFDDQYYTGTITAPLWQAEIERGDTIHVELISMDEANYEYLYTLDSSNDEGGFSAAPANPRSNLEGNALGYFGAFTTDTLSIIIPE